MVNMTKYDVIGLGNPMVDILLKVEDEHLDKFNLRKGGGRMVTKKEQDKILLEFGSEKAERTTGDSTANTLSALSILGAKVAYIGKIGDDENGIYYEKTLVNNNFISRIVKCNSETGRCLVLITKDKQRSFAVNLGAVLKIKKEDILEEDIKKSRIFHFTGWQLTEPELKEAAMRALELAKKHGLLISFDLADSFQIKKNLEAWKDIVGKYADIIFANEDEALAYTGLKAEEAVKNIKKNAIVCVKLGEKGSIISDKGKIIKVKAKKTKAVDTTGAGDAYAAGILYGILRNMSFEEVGELASHISSKVVEQIGARLRKEHLSGIKLY